MFWEVACTLALGMASGLCVGSRQIESLCTGDTAAITEAGLRLTFDTQGLCFPLKCAAGTVLSPLQSINSILVLCLSCR